MRNVKLEDLKKEIGDLFEDTVEEVIDSVVAKDANACTVNQNTNDSCEDAVSSDGVFIADNEETAEMALPIEDVSVEDIFSTQPEENGESQTIQPIETDKPSSKFKSVEELEKAYNSLEKEFTKRCQKLAQLEKEMSEGRVDTPDKWKAKVDKFFSETPEAKTFAREMALEISHDNTLRSRKDCLEVALNRVLVKKYRNPKDLATDEEFLMEHIIGSDFVKKAVIDRYMKDLRDGKPPVLMSRAGQNTVAPRNKPKTIADAGRLFQQNNK